MPDSGTAASRWCIRCQWPGRPSGRVSRPSSGLRVVVADLAAYLAGAPRPAVHTDARCPGLRAGAFTTVTAHSHELAG
jgi:hypothetical protein